MTDDIFLNIFIIAAAVGIVLGIMYAIIRAAINGSNLTKYARMNANFNAFLCRKQGITNEEMKKITDAADPEKVGWTEPYVL